LHLSDKNGNLAPVTISITNCELVTPGRRIPGATLSVAEGKIADLPGPAEQCFEAGGLTAVPGFIDIHTHGAAGASVTDATPDAIFHMAETKLTEGVTTFLPTTLSLAPDHLEDCLRAIAGATPGSKAKIPGAHLEGPFLNPRCAGAQNPEHLRTPNLTELEKLFTLAPTKILSIAPELPGATACIRAAAAAGTTVSLAHTAATRTDVLAAKSAGATHLTHFGNQMSPLHHRELGVVGSGLLDDDLVLELIADGVHLAPEMIRLAFKTVPVERLVLVTDSIAASHLGDGDYDLGGLHTTVSDGVARLPDGTLAGSTLTFDQALRTALEASGLMLPDIIATTAYNQARSLGIPGGRLETGDPADITLLDGELNVRAVFVDGELLYGTLPEIS